MGGDLLNVSRFCTTAISRPPASTRGDTEVARGRDVALCTVEAAFQTRPHAALRAIRTRGVGFLGYILYALHAKCRCCVCKNVGCVVLHGSHVHHPVAHTWFCHPKNAYPTPHTRVWAQFTSFLQVPSEQKLAGG